MFQCDRNPNKGATQHASGTTVNKPAQKLKKKYQKLYSFKRTDQYSETCIKRTPSGNAVVSA